MQSLTTINPTEAGARKQEVDHEEILSKSRMPIWTALHFIERGTERLNLHDIGTLEERNEVRDVLGWMIDDAEKLSDLATNYLTALDAMFPQDFDQ